jgi:alcohol dehydrogenase
MYGFGDLGGDWGGALSDLVRVPFADFMLVPMPAGLEPREMGSLPDNIVDGWRTVGPWLRSKPRSTVFVMGGGAASVGLYAAGIAVAMDAAEVAYVDPDPARREIARRLGVNTLSAAPPEKLRPVYDVTVEASASAGGLSAAIRSTRPGGVCTSVGIYYQQETPMPLLAMYGTGITFVHGRVNSRTCMDEALPLITSGKFRPQLVTGVTADWEQAPEALLDPAAKVIVTRS